MVSIITQDKLLSTDCTISLHLKSVINGDNWKWFTRVLIIKMLIASTHLQEFQWNLFLSTLECIEIPFIVWQIAYFIGQSISSLSFSFFAGVISLLSSLRLIHSVLFNFLKCTFVLLFFEAMQAAQDQTFIRKSLSNLLSHFHRTEYDYDIPKCISTCLTLDYHF